jgi:[ribosomal protein S5]-alanine N-acetyltransferase
VLTQDCDVSIGQTAIRTRLRAQRPWREHERLYTDLFADPAVAARLWPGTHGGVRTGAQSSEILDADIAHWVSERFGPWVFFEADTDVFIGRGGLRRTTVADEECIEILYAVRSDAWGHGYATEMALLAVSRARELGLADVVGLAASANQASVHVLEKCGLRFDPRERFEYAGLPHRLGRLRLRD